jgi:Cdc6-like AAA superfamily ATPase
VVPEDRNPQEFKDEILKESFTPQELAHREEFIKTLGRMTNSRWTKFQLWLDRFVKGSSVQK